jgi:hypothetical protein
MRQARDAEHLVFVNIHSIPRNGEGLCESRMDFLPVTLADVLESRSAVVELRITGQRLLEAR